LGLISAPAKLQAERHSPGGFPICGQARTRPLHDISAHYNRFDGLPRRFAAGAAQAIRNA
jgi:hypothetical protein